MTKVEEAIEEIDQKLAVFTPEYEGFLDWARLNVKPDTLAALQAAQVVWFRRLELLHQARTANTALMADGHPDLSGISVSAMVFADLKENEMTIEAALKRFSGDMADSITLIAEPPQPK